MAASLYAPRPTDNLDSGEKQVHKKQMNLSKKNKKEICEFLKYPCASLSWEENHLAQHAKRTPQYVTQTHEASQALELKAT